MSSVSQNSKRLCGGACQLWQFLRLLPLLIFDNIDDINDEVWKCIILLSEIVEIICAPAIHKACISYLDLIIKDYIYLRKSLFVQPLRPKHHYLLHYPSLILKFGPLMKVWTMRFESKHCFMKRAIRFSRNFINITKSLACKHELFQSFIRLGGEIHSDIIVKKTFKFNLNIYNESIKQALQIIKFSPNIFECNEIIKNGVSYCKGDAVFISQQGYRYETIVGQIIAILHDEPEIHFLLEVFQTVFIYEYGIYKLKTMPLGLSAYKCLSVSELISHEKLHIYNINSILCVKPKFGVVRYSL